MYIAGPISRLPYDTARGIFGSAADAIRKMGGVPINPMKEEDTPNGLSYGGYMKRGLKELLDCDAICLLLGWRESYGALTEQRVAESIGLKSYEAIMGNKIVESHGGKIIETFEEVNETQRG